MEREGEGEGVLQSAAEYCKSSFWQWIGTKADVFYFDDAQADGLKREMQHSLHVRKGLLGLMLTMQVSVASTIGLWCC